jgi:hypothetical protein
MLQNITSLKFIVCKKGPSHATVFFSESTIFKVLVINWSFKKLDHNEYDDYDA